MAINLDKKYKYQNKLIFKYNLIIIVILIFIFQISSSFADSWKDNLDSAKFYQEKYEYKTALKFAQIALPIVEKEYRITDTNYTNILSQIAEIYYNLGNLDSAIYYGDNSTSLNRKIYTNDNTKLAESINSLATFYIAKRNFIKAEPLYIESYEMYKRIYKTDNPELAKSINSLGYFYKISSNFEKAEKYYSEALEMRRRLYKTDNPELASSLNNMALFYKGQSNYIKAEPLYIEALEMRRRLYQTDNPDLASSINNLATLYYSMGKLSLAEPLYIEALAMYRRIYKSDHTELAANINNLASFYKNRGDFANAEIFFNEALEMRRRLYKTDNPELARNINNLASFYYSNIFNNNNSNEEDGKNNIKDISKNNNINRAELLFIEALEMRRRLYKTDNPELANSMINLANLYFNKGEYAKSEPLYIEGLNMFRKVYKTDNTDLANGIFCLGNYYNGINNFTKAEPLYIEALEMYKRIYKFDNLELSRSIFSLANLYFNDINKENNLEKAEPLFTSGISIIINILNNYFPSLSEKEKKQFLSTIDKSFEEFNNYAIQRYAQNPNISSKMYDIQLYTKGLLFNSTSKIKNRIMSSGDTLLIKKYKEFTDKNEQLAKSYSMSEEERKKKRINIDSLEKIANNIEKELSLKSELYIQSSEKKKINWRSIQALLKPDEVAVEVVRFKLKNNNNNNNKDNDKENINDTIFYAFLIVSEQTVEYPDLIFIKDGYKLENDYYKEYRTNVKNKFPDIKSFDRYWGKLYDKLKDYKKIFFSADGVYNKLNPSTLMKPDGKYLLEEQDIQQINSTKDILLNFYQTKQESNIFNSAILIGNPNFSLSEFKVTEVSKKISGQKNNQDFAFNNLERGTDIIRERRDIDLSNLPGTEIEIKDIEKFLKNKKWEVSTFIGDMAIKGAVKTAESPRVLHIATHGMFLADVKKEDKETFGFDTQKLIENPLLRSGLFFTGANSLKGSTDNEENGLLTAYEAMNLNLDKTELVVLSACETGLGETKNGEGVFGLRRAFQQAGAKTIIMSLWSVSDDATQELMSKFYSYWVSGMSKRDSFNKAQLDIKTKYKSPYYWGAFVMVGE
jgi:CHAT domain-containing protein/Flp pilus assembly protein TadD